MTAAEEITPIPVHVAGVSRNVLPGASRKRMKATYETYILTANEPAQNILPQDPKRYSYHILAIDNDIVIGPTKGVVASPVNQGPAAAGQAELLPSNPAAGSNYTYTNSTGAAQQLLSATATLVTDATVLNRFTSLRILDAAGNIVVLIANGSTVVASSTLIFQGFLGAAQQNAAVGAWIFPLPQGLMLQPGWQVIIGASTLDAGDQVSAVRLTFSQSASLIANPNGAYLPKGTWREFEDNGIVYVGATTTAASTRITVIAEYYE